MAQYDSECNMCNGTISGVALVSSKFWFANWYKFTQESRPAGSVSSRPAASG